MIPLEVIALSPYAREWAAEQARRSARRGFRDRARRDIELGEWEPGDWSGLVSLYQSSNDTANAGGFLPLSPERRAVWVEQLLSRGPNIVARASGCVVGHAALVAYDRGDSHELVVFVHRDYRGAGIGGALVDALLAAGRRQRIDRLWLTVDRENHCAATLFGARGFRVGRGGNADAMAAASWGMNVWTLSLGGTRRTRSFPIASFASASWRGVRIVGDAMRLVMIPLVCALVIAVASEDPRGRTLAIILALASIGFGLAVRGRSLVRGQRDRGIPNDYLTTDEWMARLR
jgi:GNAT superfamily N-acetyltransferase